jgi:hypothetical protein
VTDVGKAKVDVEGDVSKFAAQVEKDLRAALSKIKLDPIKVPVEVDSDKAGQAGEDAGRAAAEGVSRGAEGALRDAKGRFVKAGSDSSDGFVDGFDKESSKNKGRIGEILKKAFTPNKGLFDALRAPFSAALSTPIGAAVVSVAGTAALAFVAAFASAIATAGLGAVFLGIGAAALFGAKKDRAEAQKDLEAAQESVRKAQQGAKSGTAEAKRSLAEARKELAAAQAVVANNAPYAKLDASLDRLGSTLGKVGREASKPLIAPFTAALDKLNAAAVKLQPVLKDIFADLAPAIGPLTDGMIGFVNEFLKALTADPKTMEGITDSLIALGDNLPRIGAALGQFFAILAGNENNARNMGLLFGLLADSIVNLGLVLYALSAALDGGIAAWNTLKAAASAFVGWITGTALPAVGGALSSIGGFFSSLATKVATAVAAAIAAFATLPGRARAVITGLISAVAAVFSSALSAARSSASNLVSSAAAIFGTLAGKVRSALSGIKGAVTGAFSGAAGWLRSAGASIVNGLVDGIRSAFGRVQSALSSLTAMLPSWKGPAEVDKKILRESGQLVMKGFQLGIEDQRADVRRALQDITSSLPNFVGTVQGGDGASAGATVIFQPGAIQITGQGTEAGQEAAEAVLERLGQATAVR